MASFLSREDELHGWGPRHWQFWRNLAVYFCVFSVVGHWMEIPYCMFNDFFFDIVEDDSLVWDDPMYPFLVYGFGTLVCTLALVPLKNWLIMRRSSLFAAGLEFYILTVLVCMLMELTMGLLLNQPDPVTGEYPLWNNAVLPGNILGQAWIVNDLLLGGIAMCYTWVVYPLLVKGAGMLSEPAMNTLSAVIVIGFIVLCVTKFT